MFICNTFFIKWSFLSSISCSFVQYLNKNSCLCRAWLFILSIKKVPLLVIFIALRLFSFCAPDSLQNLFKAWGLVSCNFLFSCRTESAAALAKTFPEADVWDVSKFLSTCTLMKSVGDQHVVSMLPACCLHVANKLPACCQHVASMLLACCQHVASLLPANY